MSTTMHPAEALAELLDDPMPSDWREPAAIAARQDHLAAVAQLAGEAALEVIRAYLEGVQLDPETPVVRRGGDEIAELVRALCCYNRETGRGDARQIIKAAVTCSAGEAVAAFVDNTLQHIIDALHQEARDRSEEKN
jgi:hypothetical protein